MIILNYMKKLVYLLVFILVSCNLQKSNKKDSFSYIDLSKSVVLDSMETIIDFYDRYPTAITIADSLMYVIQTKAEDCMLVLNLKTKQIIDSLGHVGHGPNELLNPNFILSVNKSDVLIEDGNLKKMMRIGRGADSIKLMKYIDYPDPIFLGSEINISEHFIVGRKIDVLEGKMFFIYKKNTDSIFEVDCFPKLEESVKDVNYTYAPTIAFNEDMNRIVVGMYFFDMFHVYDMTGKRMKTCCFSEKSIPNVNKKEKILDLSSGYSGVIRTFSTKDYCYLLRMTQEEDNFSSKCMIIQLDWDGNLINSYLFNDEILGQFYVDEENSKIYIMRRYVNFEDEEVFGIVSYRLPKCKNKDKSFK